MSWMIENKDGYAAQHLYLPEKVVTTVIFNNDRYSRVWSQPLYLPEKVVTPLRPAISQLLPSKVAAPVPS